MELIAAARKLGSTYPDVTLRTMLIHHLRVDEGRAAPGEGFFRLGPGRYGLAPDQDAASPDRALKPGATPTVQREPAPEPEEHAEEWHWEGRVQAAVVRWLAANGRDITRVSDTASREQGFDIEARRGADRLLVEVKGYPSATYRRGASAGESKRYGAATQARTYFGNALLAGMLMRSEHQGAQVALAFPDVTTFRSLAERTAGPLRSGGLVLWLVSEQGAVTAVEPGR